MDTFSRRTVLNRIGLTTAMTYVATVGTVGADLGKSSVDDGLFLDAEVQVSGAREVVTQDGYAYVAYGVRTSGQPRIRSGMAIVDLTSDPRPQVVAKTDVEKDYVEWYNEQNADTLSLADVSFNILDVKVDGNVAALANNNGLEQPGGISLYDVSDPADPQFRSQYEPTFDDSGPAPGANIHNCFLADDHAYLTLAEPWNVDNDDDPKRDEIWIFGDTGVDIADISDPANPEHASRWLLKDVAPEVVKSSRAPCHDVYVQDGICYAALWDAGTAALDVSEEDSPDLISRFGSVLDAGDAIPAYDFTEPIGNYLDREWDFTAYLTAPGNDHYVQPSPDGDHVFVGAETFPKAVGVSDPGVDDYGGITVWDTSDLNAPLTRIDPPVIDDDDSGKLFTSHNFDVTADRLHTSWYHGGVHLYNITDPANPQRLAGYDPDGYAFWTAVHDRGFTIGGVYGDESDRAGGLTVLHPDSGEKQSPAFDGSTPPATPEVMPEDQRE